MNFDTGSLSRTLPSSTSIKIATAATGFDIDAIRKIVSVCIGFFEAMSMTPCAARCAIWPLRATSVTAPAISPASIERCTSSSMRCKRSLEMPTLSGGTGSAPASARAIGSAATSSANQQSEVNRVSVCIIPRERAERRSGPSISERPGPANETGTASRPKKSQEDGSTLILGGGCGARVRRNGYASWPQKVCGTVSSLRPNFIGCRSFGM